MYANGAVVHSRTEGCGKRTVSIEGVEPRLSEDSELKIEPHSIRTEEIKIIHAAATSTNNRA